MSGNGRLGAVRKSHHVSSRATRKLNRVDDSRRISWEADGDHYVTLANAEKLFEHFTSRRSLNEFYVIEHHSEIIVQKSCERGRGTHAYYIDRSCGDYF